VVVRAFDGMGAGRYTDVIAGLNWIVANRVKYKIAFSTSRSARNRSRITGTTRSIRR